MMRLAEKQSKWNQKPDGSENGGLRKRLALAQLDKLFPLNSKQIEETVRVEIRVACVAFRSKRLF